MKVNRKELIGCLKVVSSLGDLHFDGALVRGGSFNFQVEVPLPSGLELTCVVPGKPVLDILKTMSADDVDIVSRRNKLHLESGGIKVDFKVLQDVVLLKKIPLTDDPILVKKLSALVSGLTAACVCVSKDELDGPLCGVRPIGSFLYSCDKFRIFRYVLEEEIKVSGSIPISFIKALSGLGEVEGTLYCGTRITFVGVDGTTITSSLLMGDYPDLSRMFPSFDPVTISFGGEQIVSVLSKHGKYQSKVDIGDQEFEVLLHENQCTITSESNLGLLQETLEMGVNIGDREIGFFVNPVLFDGVEKRCTSCDFYPEDGIVMFVSGPSEYLIRTKE